jgi:hypothetical protein
MEPQWIKNLIQNWLKIVSEDLISAVRLTSSKYFYHILNKDLEALMKTTSRMLSQPVPELGNFQLQRRHANIFNVCLLLSCYTYNQCYELN